MFLRELFSKPKNLVLNEGGNLEIDNPNFDPSKPESPTNLKVLRAQEIKLQSTEISDEVQDRTHMVGVLRKLFLDINERFFQNYKTYLFKKTDLEQAIEEFMAGSSKHFFNLLRPNPNFNPNQPESQSNPKMIGISDEEFKKYKPNVGDIDIQCNEQYKEQIFEFLNNSIGVPFDNITLLGKPESGNEQYNTLWQLVDPPIKIQIDFEYGRYSPVTQKPDEWTAFSHSASWDDIKEGIKGVFHKYIFRALAKAEPTPKYVVRLDGLGKNRKMKIFGGPDAKVEITDYTNPPEPIIDPNFSFSVASAGGGGLRYKYKDLDPQYTKDPYNFPTLINGIPVLHALKSEESEYEQDLSKQFTSFFGAVPQGNDRTLQNSFIGTLELMNKYLSDEEKRNTVQDFLEILFEPGSQMITRDDPSRDQAIKFAAVNKMLPVLGLDDMLTTAQNMSNFYIADHNDLKQFQQKYDKENPNPVNAKGQPKKPQYRKERSDAIKAGTWKPLNSPAGQTLSEAETPSFTRKGIPHIYAKKPDGTPSSMEIKDLDFLELCQEIANNGGNLDGIQINEKIDGAGIRFGKDQSGNPFFMIGGLDQQFYAGDVGWFEQNSRGDPERAKAYDMAMDIITNSKFIQTLPNDTLVQSEMLFDPNQQDNSVDGVNTFVNIPYQTKQLGQQMTLVPIFVKQLSTGQSFDPTIEQDIITKLVSLSDNNIKIISNQLQQSGIDVGNIIRPVIANYDQYKAILSSKKKTDLEAKEQVKQELNVVKKQLSDTIIKSPKLKGIGKLGDFYEGIVINMPGGPVKVTSSEMKAAMLKKMENQFNKSDQSPRVAVVAIGSMVGHKGHEQLINFTIDKARELKGKAFVYVGSAVGPKDPIPVDMKLETLHKIFGPNSSTLEISPVEDQLDASTGRSTGGTHFKKIEKELVKKRPFYNQVYIMVGSDYAAQSQIDIPQPQSQQKDTGIAKQAETLQARLGSWSPTEHVKIDLIVTPRGADEGGTGKSTSLLRDTLTQESTGAITKEQAFATWRSSFSPRVDDNWVLQLMAVARDNMKLAPPEQMQPATQTQPINKTQQPASPSAVTQTTATTASAQTQPIKPVAERLSNALIRPRKTYEGGFTSLATQATEVTPDIINSVKAKIDNQFLSDFNSWLLSRGFIKNGDAVKPGVVTGSGAHHKTDPKDTIYGDIDMQINVPDLYQGQLHTTGERQYRWKKLVLDFIKDSNPDYINKEESLSSGLPVINLGNNLFIQADLMPHPQKYSEWGQYRATAERGVTGLLNGNLFAVLGELLSLNLQHSGVQFKTPKQGGLRQKFDSLKKGEYDLGEISANVKTFILDILKDEHREFGQDELIVDPLLSKNPGVKTVDNLDDLRIQPLVNAIKGLARSFELNNLYGKGNLAQFQNSDDFLKQFTDLYAVKAQYAATNKKFDKATTDELKSHVARKQEKIRNGLEYVLFLFDTEGQAPRYLDWLKNKENNLYEMKTKRSRTIVKKQKQLVLDENIENIMRSLIKNIIINETIQNNNRKYSK